MFTEVVIVRPLQREGRQLQPGDTLAIGAVEAAELVRDRYAVPAGCRLVPELRPVRGEFVTRARK